MHEHVNIHILLSLLWDYVHTVVCEKCLVQIESVFLQAVCTGPLTVLTFVASGLDINGSVLSYFEGQQIYTVIQAVHSLLYIVAKCHFFSVVT